MSQETRELERIALDVSRAAAALVLEGFSTSFAVSTKAHEELFTEYDLKSEELVRRLLEERTPGVPIVGEEHGGVAGADLTWYVDPIDGTINFIAGHPWFAVSVGIKRGDQPIAGAVVAPALAMEWWGSSELGAKRNGKPCRVSDHAELANAIVATGLPARRGVSQAETDLRWAQFARINAAVLDIRRCGSAAIDLCLVADGTYALYWMRQLSPWDTAAGAALVLGAGGEYTALDPGALEAHDVASNGRVLPEFLELLNIQRA